MVIRTPDYHLRVFVSSTLKDLVEERKAVRQAIEKLRLAPVMFESGARPHPAQELYKSYLSQSQVFIGIYWQSYGWIAPDMHISGLEDEYVLSGKMPRLIYIKKPAPEREPALTELLDRIRDDNTSSYTYFSSPSQLKQFVENDLALLLTERFEAMNESERPTAEDNPLPPTNIPYPRNALIGRENDMAALDRLLKQDDVALITLTGPGGTGKSRLAIQIGLEMLTYFRDGVYLVGLESVSDPERVIPAIAETLGLHEALGSKSITEMLKDLLRSKQILLILDNFEQVVDAAPQISDLLEACPKLKCIVTSRAPLRLRIEKEVPVPTLLVPLMRQVSSYSSLSQYAAVELFIQRAQAVKSDFSVTNANAPAVAEICSRLDGLPLAIELAAARIKLLTPQGLLSRLEHRFDLLTGGTRDLPARQRTLRGTIDWSFNLLNETEKKLFRRLSVFTGGWTLEAAEVICDINGDIGYELDDALSSLIDNNMVVQLPETDGQPRFGMLSTIHDYADEQMTKCDEAQVVHSQHIRFYLDFVTRVEPLIRSAERVRWQQVMQQEFGNIRGALEWVWTTRNSIELGQQIAINLGFFWPICGYIAEGYQWCNKMLTLCDESTPVKIRSGLLGFTGVLAWSQGDQLSAVKLLDESLVLCRQLDDQNLLANLLVCRGIVASAARDLETAAQSYEEGIALSKATKNEWGEAIALSWMGDIALYQNDLVRATTLHAESVKVARSQGDPWCLMPSLMSTAQTAVMEGDLERAHKNLTEAVNVLHNTLDYWSLAWTLIDLGHVASLQGDLDQASSCFLESLSLAKTYGNLRASIIILAEAAAVIATRSPNDLAGMTLAANLCGATAPYLDTPGMFIWFDTKKLYDDAISQAKSIIDSNLWDRGYTEGQSMPLEHATELATQALKK